MGHLRWRVLLPVFLLSLACSCGATQTADSARTQLAIATTVGSTGAGMAVGTSTAASTPMMAATPTRPPRGAATAVPAQQEVTLDLHMLSPTNGWAIQARALVLMAGGQATFSLLRTTDGGSRWSDASPPGFQGDDRFGTAFLDADRAWMAIPSRSSDALTLWHTTDGAATWQEPHLSTPYQTLALATVAPVFSDLRHGWLLVSEHPSRTTCAPAELLATADGGETWQLVSSTDAATPGHLPFAGGLVLQSSSHGWLEGNPTCLGPGLLYETGDGGRTWQQLSLSSPLGRHGQVRVDGPPTLLPPDPQAGFLTAQFVPTDRNQAGFAHVLYTTRDGGHSWSAIVLPSQGEVTFVNSQDGWLWEPRSADGASGGVLSQTRNGGRTWEVIKPASKQASLLQSGGDVGHLHFVSPQVGWATVIPAGRQSTEILHTTDGGKNWSAIFRGSGA